MLTRRAPRERGRECSSRFFGCPKSAVQCSDDDDDDDDRVRTAAVAGSGEISQQTSGRWRSNKAVCAGVWSHTRRGLVSAELTSPSNQQKMSCTCQASASPDAICTPKIKGAYLYPPTAAHGCPALPMSRGLACTHRSNLAAAVSVNVNPCTSRALLDSSDVAGKRHGQENILSLVQFVHFDTPSPSIHDLYSAPQVDAISVSLLL